MPHDTSNANQYQYSQSGLCLPLHIPCLAGDCILATTVLLAKLHQSIHHGDEGPSRLEWRGVGGQKWEKFSIGFTEDVVAKQADCQK